MPQIEQISSFLVILVIFLLLLYGSYYFSKKVAGASIRGNQSKYMKVLDRIMLSRDTSVAVVSVGCRYYLVASSPGGMNLLGEIEEEDLIELQNPQNPFSGALSFHDIMKKIGKEKEPKP